MEVLKPTPRIEGPLKPSKNNKNVNSNSNRGKFRKGDRDDIVWDSNKDVCLCAQFVDDRDDIVWDEERFLTDNEPEDVRWIQE